MSARRAPELSAILRIDSCCTTVPPSWSPPLLRALDYVDHAPPLGPRQRPRLDDPHRVARLGALVVVRGDLLGADDLLTVEPVREAAHERDRDGLLHLVAHHTPVRTLRRPLMPASSLTEWCGSARSRGGWRAAA